MAGVRAAALALMAICYTGAYADDTSGAEEEEEENTNEPISYPLPAPPPATTGSYFFNPLGLSATNDEVAHMYFDWHYYDWEEADTQADDTFGHWSLRRAVPKASVDTENRHDITVQYRKVYGEQSVERQLYNMFWEGGTMKKTRGGDSDITQRVYPESSDNVNDGFVIQLWAAKGMSNKTASDHYELSDGKKFYYNVELAKGEERPLNNLATGDAVSIEGTFIRNHVNFTGTKQDNSKADPFYGGSVVYNGKGAHIESIKGEFIGNYARGTAGSSTITQGGVIYNDGGKIDSIDGIFLGNYTHQRHGGATGTRSTTGSGGVIYNSEGGEIGSIRGTFVGNYLYNENPNDDLIGGVICSYGKITGGIDGTFIGNFVYAGYTANSGVVRNFTSSTWAEIGTFEDADGNEISIDGTFIGNYARGVYGNAYGGIMRNNGLIRGEIRGEYIGNYALTEGKEGYVFVPIDDARTSASRAQGGAYYNTVKAENMNANNSGKTVALQNIIADFKYNYAQSKWGQAEGGAIFNENATIQNIQSNFTGNHVVSRYYTARGGAIFNNWIDYSNDNNWHDPSKKVTEKDVLEALVTRIGKIGNEGKDNHAKFISNYAQGVTAEGGAIYVSSGATTQNIYADFTNNYAVSDVPDGYDKMRDKQYTITFLTSPQKTEKTKSYADVEAKARGGALFVADNGEVGEIEGDFIGNFVTGKGHVRGGAILVTKGTIGHIEGLFKDNYAYGSANNAKDAMGGAIRFDGSVIHQLTVDFKKNWTNGSGGALSVSETGYIIEISGTFEDNYAGIMGGAVHNEGTIGVRGKALTVGEAPLESDYSNALFDEETHYLKLEQDETEGYNDKYRHEYDGTITGGFVNANFINNYITGDERGFGGAIYTDKDLFITAKKTADGKSGESKFSGNMVYYKEEGVDKKIQSAIYVDNSLQREDEAGMPIPVTIYLMAEDGSTIQFDDRIRGVESATERFVLRMRGYTDKIEDSSTRKTIPTTPGVVILNNLVMDSYAIMDDVTLKLGIPEIDKNGDYAKEQKYDSDFDRSILPESMGTYKQSYVLARSHFSARSGTVDLTADDGALTEYIFGSMIAYGKNYNYSAEGSTTSDYIKNVYTGNNERFATFAVDIKLEKGFDKTANSEVVLNGWSDIITVFEDKRADKDVFSEGLITLTGLAIKSGSDYGILYNNNPEKLKNENSFKIQILNLVVIGKDGQPWKEKDYKDNGYWLPMADRKMGETLYSNSPIELDTCFNTIRWEKSIMFSDEILAADIQLDTTKTHNDSLRIIGWRDNLAAWAEISDTLPEDHLWEWSEGTDTNNKKKIFYLTEYDEKLQPDVNRKDPTHYLTRNINYKSPGNSATAGDANPVIWGNDVTIRGLGKDAKRNTLDLQGYNLLSQIGGTGFEKQHVQLRNFILKGVMKQTMKNDANLTLDSMDMEKELTIYNNNDMVIQGIMDVDFKITASDKPQPIDGTGSAASRSTLTFDDKSVITEGKTRSTINNTIEHHDITLTEKYNSKTLPSPSKLTPSAFDDANFTTVVNLPTTSDGKNQTAAFQSFSDNSLAIEGGKFNLGDMYTHQLSLVNFSMQGGAVYVNHSTVDLAKKEMGRIIASGDATYTSGSIWLNGMRLISDGAYRVTHVQFVNESMGDAVFDNEIRNNKIRGPIHEYTVTYADSTQKDEQGKTGRNGYYTFVYTGRVNPEIQSGAAAELADTNQMLQVYDYSFEHADLYSSTIANTRLAGRSDYAVVSPVKGYKEAPAATAPCATNPAALKGGMWVRTYASFEKMPLNNGPRVSANMYGALVGVDSDLKELRYGWGAVCTLYGNYLGNSLRYDSVRINENGGGAGLTGTFYRGNFYTALTASANTISGRARNSYGSEDYDTLMFGIASRTGYTYIPRNCKYALQPTLQVSYTQVDMKDYTNAAGVRVDSKPLQTLQLYPYLKGLMHTNSGWDPYVTLGYVYNGMGKTKFRANGYQLPQLSIDPYAEYSIGVQKTWKNRFTLYGQATGRSGGRNGAEANIGFRMAW